MLFSCFKSGVFERFGAQLGKRDDILRRFRVVGNKLFHPHHVVPCSEFIATLIKPADRAVSEVLVIFGAVIGQMLVGRIRPADSGL